MFVLLLGAQVVAQPLWAGACVCVKRNMENEVIEFSCTELTGEDGGAAGCSNHCKGEGFNGYDWLSDETCNGLYKRIKKQKVDIDIKEIQIGPIGIGIDGEASASSVQSPAPSPSPILVGTGTIEAHSDTFDVPRTLGGGRHTTSAFSGTLDFRLEPDANDPDKYRVVVTGVSTVVQSMNLNGFETGVLHGSLNPEAPNDGELNVATGQISFLFSQILYPEDFPGVEIHTWSHYYGTCNDCLNGGDATLEADSFFISPFE